VGKRMGSTPFWMQAKRQLADVPALAGYRLDIGHWSGTPVGTVVVELVEVL